MKAAAAVTGIISMTGFAQARADRDGTSLRINLRSVNHRFLDLHLRMPDGCEVFETRIRQAIRSRIRRGHVDVNVYFEAAGNGAIEVNREVAESYLRAVERLRNEFQVKTEPDLVALFRLPGVVAAPGSALAEEMKGILTRIAGRTAEIEGLAVGVRPAIARRLAERLNELLSGVQLDPTRLAQEAALLAERSDVSEELARLRSHVEQFRKLLTGTGEAGKKLDFLLQEMQREANTLLSKTPGVESEGLAITALALEVKSDIEKLREQAQNVE